VCTYADMEYWEQRGTEVHFHEVDEDGIPTAFIGYGWDNDLSGAQRVLMLMASWPPFYCGVCEERFLTWDQAQQHFEDDDDDFGDFGDGLLVAEPA
jgi:hypothetical protein